VENGVKVFALPTFTAFYILSLIRRQEMSFSVLWRRSPNVMKEQEMSKSRFSVRAAVAGALGAGALSGAMLFGALPRANAAQAPAAPAAGSGQVVLTGIHSHHDHHRHDLHHSVNIL
jgi:hypothetical protein